jgi:hypothetical protein
MDMWFKRRAQDRRWRAEKWRKKTICASERF